MSEKLMYNLPERSPIEQQADNCGELITISRQWYEETIEIIKNYSERVGKWIMFAEEDYECPFCNTPNDRHGNFCENCGAYLPEVEMVKGVNQ